MHEADSWFDLDVRIDEPARQRQGFSPNTFTSDLVGSMTTDITVPAQVAEARR